MLLTLLKLPEGLEGDAHDLHALLTRVDALLGQGEYEGKIETPILSNDEDKKAIVKASHGLINSFWLAERAHLREHKLTGFGIDAKRQKEAEQVRHYSHFTLFPSSGLHCTCCNTNNNFSFARSPLLYRRTATLLMPVGTPF